MRVTIAGEVWRFVPVSADSSVWMDPNNVRATEREVRWIHHILRMESDADLSRWARSFSKAGDAGRGNVVVLERCRCNHPIHDKRGRTGGRHRNGHFFPDTLIESVATPDGPLRVCGECANDCLRTWGR